MVLVVKEEGRDFPLLVEMVEKGDWCGGLLGFGELVLVNSEVELIDMTDLVMSIDLG